MSGRVGGFALLQLQVVYVYIASLGKYRYHKISTWVNICHFIIWYRNFTVSCTATYFVCELFNHVKCHDFLIIVSHLVCLATGTHYTFWHWKHLMSEPAQRHIKPSKYRWVLCLNRVFRLINTPETPRIIKLPYVYLTRLSHRKTLMIK